MTATGPMGEEQAVLAASHRRLLAAIDGLTDDDVRRDSRLPGWSVGHLLTHIARNADSFVRRMGGAARGEVVEQYAGGADGRAAEIEAGAGRSAAELVADVRDTAAEVERVCAELPDEAWDRLGRSVGGQQHSMRRVLTSRIREVEMHHVDLGLGYEPRDWPEAFARSWIDAGLWHVMEHADPRDLLGWISGRGPAPQLPPWP